ncbi:MAG: thioredoxin family protein [Bacilli bacterium]|jgi:predicted bacteriocin transport accessory protein|nr:thioredoxin family protein [Bacilli bacterium]
MKRKFTLLACLIMIIVVVGCGAKEPITHIQPSDIAQKIEKKETFVVEVASSNCAHCINFAPTIEKYAKEHPDISFNRIMLEEVKNAEEQTIFNDYTVKYTIKGTPTTLYFKDGNYQGQIGQNVSESTLDTKTKEYLK